MDKLESQIYDTIIVGGGIAGLTSAVYLARAGQNILLIEKNEEFGGLVSSFKSNGFHFEAGLRALESAGIILPMLKDLGIELEYVRSKVSVGIENRILHIEDYDSIRDYKNLLNDIYPGNEADIENFIKSMRKIMKMLDVLYGIENPLFKDLKKDRNYIFKTLLPWLPKFLFTIGKINRLNIPFETYLGKIIKNQSLKDIISQHFFKSTPTFFALSYFSLYLDYFYPIGGVGKIVDALVDKIKLFNGKLQTNTIIKEINAEYKFVLDDNQQKYQYRNLIWAADLKTLYNSVILGNIDTKTKDKIEITKKMINSSKGSESVFSLYLKVNLPLSYFCNISHGHFFYNPSKEGLGNIHRSELESLLLNWKEKSKEDIIAWFDRFLLNNTFEISIPGLKDSTLVPENKTGLIVSFIVDYAIFKKLEESDWYNEIKQVIEQKIILILSNSIYPELKNNIESYFSFTPISIKNRVGSTDGSIVGWSFESHIPVIHKIQRSDKSVLTPIPNIYQAGQWAYSPAGVPMSILTGKLAADHISKNK